MTRQTSRPPGSSSRAWLWLAVLLPMTVMGSCWACGGNEVHTTAFKPTQSTPRNAVLDVAGREVFVELSYTNTTRAKGLMARTKLETDSGMLFLFTDEQPRKFWMQNTLIALDIAFLDETGTVLNVEHGRPGVEVPGYSSAGPARFVLEMESGWCAAAGLGPGDRIEIPQRLRDLAEPGV